MGKFVGSALAGVVGSALFFGCGAGATGPIEEATTFEADGATSGIDPTGSAKSAWAGEDAGGEDDDGGIVVDAAIGEDAAVVVDAAVNVDSGSSMPDSGGSVPAMFDLPGRLIVDQATACWSGPVITNECKPVPVTDPPIYETSNECAGNYWPSIRVRVPPHTCAKFTAQSKTGACALKSDDIPTRCAKSTNATDQDHWVTVRYERVVIRWEHESVCPYVSCD